MKIVCKVIRPGGTVVEFGHKKYHFKPETEGGHHVAEVTDQAHIDRLLSITEAYVPLANADDAPVDEPAPEPDADEPVSEWSNKKAMAYAKEVLGLNPEDKNDIIAFAAEKGITLGKNKGVATLIRELVGQIGVEPDEDE